MLSLGGLNSGSLKDLQLVISFSTDFAIHTKVRGRAWSHCLGSKAKIKLPMKVTIQFLLPLVPGGGTRLPPPTFLGQFTACSHPLSCIGWSFEDAQSKLCYLFLICFSLCCSLCLWCPLTAQCRCRKEVNSWSCGKGHGFPSLKSALWCGNWSQTPQILLCIINVLHRCDFQFLT